MSMIGNTPGVSSQRTVLEEVVTGSPKSNFVPQGGYVIGYVDVLVNGTEIDTSDFTAADGVNINLAVAAAVGDTVKIKAWLPRGLSDGYLKTEADARYVHLTGAETIAGNKTFSNTVSADRVKGVTAVHHGSFGYWKSRDNSGGAEFALEYATSDTMADDNIKLSLSNAGELYPRGNLKLAAGKGIDFSANANTGGMTGEVLDDYEVGNWTPALYALDGNQSITYGVQVGTYTKIGRLVFAKGYLLINSIANKGTSGLGITGLPFSVTEEVDLNFSDNNALTNYYSASLTQMYGYGASGGSIHLRAAGGSNSLYRPIPNSPLQTGYLLFSVTYQTT